jgi:hypothetical protein
VSVDVPATGEGTTIIAAALARHHVAATWAFAEEIPAGLPGVSELGVLASANWASRRSTRSAFAAELERRASFLRTQGSVQTLVLEGELAHADIARQQGINSIRFREPSSQGLLSRLFAPAPRGELRAPEMVKGGLWLAPAALTFAAGQSPSGLVQAAIPLVDSAAQTGQLCHLAVEAPTHRRTAASVAAALSETLAHAQRVDGLEIVSAGAAVERLAAAHARTRNVGSFLRRAA